LVTGGADDDRVRHVRGLHSGAALSLDHSEKSLHLFDLSAKAIDPIITYDSTEAKLAAVSFSPDGKNILVAHLFSRCLWLIPSDWRLNGVCNGQSAGEPSQAQSRACELFTLLSALA
jgi:hypothetical protein